MWWTFLCFFLFLFSACELHPVFFSRCCFWWLNRIQYLVFANKNELCAYLYIEGQMWSLKMHLYAHFNAKCEQVWHLCITAPRWLLVLGFPRTCVNTRSEWGHIHHHVSVHTAPPRCCLSLLKLKNASSIKMYNLKFKSKMVGGINEKVEQLL